MKRVVKNEPPAWFEAWKKSFEEVNGRKASYKTDFPQGEIRRLREGLLKEQGHLCCYCMGRLDLAHSHVEHFRPKKKFPDEDMDYDNLFASCDGVGEEPAEDHCGHRKDDWYLEGMISPADPEVERAFRYGVEGTVYPSGKDEERRIAKEMIEHLGLNSYYLVRNRAVAIEESGFFDDAEYGEEEIRDMIDYYDHMDNGMYVPYCGAIVEAWRSLL